MTERLGVGGVDLSPAVIRGLLTMNPAELLKKGFESLENDGPMPVLVEQYEAWVKHSRRFGELLSEEDAVAIEQRTALADLSQYVAHRQILQQTALLESQLPTRPVRPLVGRKEVPTRVLDEDHYPIGGYTSISNRGSMESLLHSQLAFMETEERPDLFDIKYARDELFYYSRDENQFLRRRRTFVFCFAPDLVAARFKDAELPCQRIVLISALVLTLIRRLEDWLGYDALRFELIFPKLGKDSPLSQEAKLFEILLLELRSRNVAFIISADDTAAILSHCATLSRAAQVQVLELAAAPMMVGPDGVVLVQLAINGPQPQLIDARGSSVELDADPVESWADAARKILAMWI
jgi:vWA domain found in the FtsH ternary systems/N-terminal helical region fused to the FtsH ternary system vWA domain